MPRSSTDAKSSFSWEKRPKVAIFHKKNLTYSQWKYNHASFKTRGNDGKPEKLLPAIPNSSRSEKKQDMNSRGRRGSERYSRHSQNLHQNNAHSSTVASRKRSEDFNKSYPGASRRKAASLSRNTAMNTDEDIDAGSSSSEDVSNMSSIGPYRYVI